MSSAGAAISNFLGSSFVIGGQAAAVTVTGAQIAAGGAALAAGLTVLFSRNKNNNIPMYGEPNSTVGRGHSEGQYDSKGHLIYRKDYATHNGFNPHTHFFKWFLKDGVWRFIKTILPF